LFLHVCSFQFSIHKIKPWCDITGAVLSCAFALDVRWFIPFNNFLHDTSIGSRINLASEGPQFVMVGSTPPIAIAMGTDFEIEIEIEIVGGGWHWQRVASVAQQQLVFGHIFNTGQTRPDLGRDYIRGRGRYRNRNRRTKDGI
jgi:hypothetical protein